MDIIRHTLGPAYTVCTRLYLRRKLIENIHQNFKKKKVNVMNYYSFLCSRETEQANFRDIVSMKKLDIVRNCNKYGVEPWQPL
jgi:hypothetical protein